MPVDVRAFGIKSRAARYRARTRIPTAVRSAAA
jgi:hypothetical protein